MSESNFKGFEEDIRKQEEKIIELMNRCNSESETKSLKKLSKKFEREQCKLLFTKVLIKQIL